MTSGQRKLVVLLVGLIGCGMSVLVEATDIIIRKKPPVKRHVYYTTSDPYAPRPSRLTLPYHHRPVRVLRPYEAAVIFGTACVALVFVAWLCRDSHEDTHHHVYHNPHHNDHVVVVHDDQPEVIVVHDDSADVIIIDDGDDDIIIVD